MTLIYRLFRISPDTRDGIITATSGLCVAVNVLIAAMKVIVGLWASSIAIISEGVNNAADALASVLTLAGTKLARKHPDSRHPFGYGRIEYLTSLVIAILILITGTEVLTSAVRLIFEPEELNVSALPLILIAVSAVIKLFLGVYTIKMGRKADSGALEAVGIECRNDAFISVITILSAVVFLVFHLSVDAYVGVFTSLIILRAGLGILRTTVSELIGRPGEKELAMQLYREILATDGILGAADMMLHNYGPDAYSGSVNIEIDHSRTVGEIYQFVHALRLRILHTYHVTMVFGIYAVDYADTRTLRQYIGRFVSASEHVRGFHAVYLDPETGCLYCDLVVDYALRDWEALRAQFEAYIHAQYPDTPVELTVETEFV